MISANATLEEKTINILDNIIKNVEPSYKEILLNYVINNVTHTRSWEIEKIIRLQMNLRHTKLTKRSKEYWIRRGWSVEYAYVHAKENAIKNISVYCREFWLDKINPETGALYTAEESDFERNSRRPIRPEYWTKKGHTMEESLLLASKQKQSNNINGAHAQKENKHINKISSKRCIEYYLIRGYSQIDAEREVKQHQTKFSLDICIEKFGEQEGYKIWQERQLRWKESFKKSGVYNGISKTSLSLFNGISEIIPSVLYGNDEKTILCGHKIYAVDLLFENKIIEFFGDYWHANPIKYKEHDLIKGRWANTIWKKDNDRVNDLIKNGYDVHIVWESEYKKCPDLILQQCIDFLKNEKKNN